MLELRDWVTTKPFDNRPWLMLGKGPSFGRRHEFDLSGYNLVSLNHAVREVKVEIAHVIDIDVIHDCEEVIAANCDFLVMPRFPHVQSLPGLASLDDYLRGSAALRRLDEENRLVWYNISTARAVGSSPVISARYFGSEAALGVLGEYGVRVVRSLGVDGGTHYATAFSSDATQTLLSNGQASFDMQFVELRRIAHKYGVDFRPLIEPLRIFVGASPGEIVPYRVLAHSIHRRSSVPVRVESLTAARSPTPKDPANKPRTAFSFSRFHIPDLCEFRGRAVYVDSDMIVVGDVAELAEHPMTDRWLACTRQASPPGWENADWFKPGRQFSVMILDCDHLDWKIDEIVAKLDRGDLTYGQLLFEMALVPSERIDDTLEPGWNSLEHFDADTRLLHYTIVPTQPWKSSDHPLGDVWMAEYEDAVRDGAVGRLEVERLVRSGGRPDLLKVFDSLPVHQSRPARNVSEVALQATLRELDRMRERTVKGALRRGATRAAPTVDRATARVTKSHDVGRLLRRWGKILIGR